MSPKLFTSKVVDTQSSDGGHSICHKSYARVQHTNGYYQWFIVETWVYADRDTKPETVWTRCSASRVPTAVQLRARYS